MSEVKQIAYSNNAWKGFIAEKWQNEIASADFEQWYNQQNRKTVVSYLSRDVTQIETAQGIIYVKEIRALTDAGLKGKDIFSFLKWVLRPSRAIAGWNISLKILQEGFLCAVPVLAIRKRNTWAYPTDYFVSEEINAPLLSEKLPTLPGNKQIEMAEIIAEQLCEFHLAGFVHGDCILRNICINENNKLIYLDNDRTKKKSLKNPFVRSKRNLAQFAYNARRNKLSEEFVDCFLEKYAEKAKWQERKKRRIIKNIKNAVEKRLHNRLMAEKKRHT